MEAGVLADGVPVVVLVVLGPALGHTLSSPALAVLVVFVGEGQLAHGDGLVGPHPSFHPGAFSDDEGTQALGSLRGFLTLSGLPLFAVDPDDKERPRRKAVRILASVPATPTELPDLSPPPPEPDELQSRGSAPGRRNQTSASPADGCGGPETSSQQIRKLMRNVLFIQLSSS